MAANPEQQRELGQLQAQLGGLIEDAQKRYARQAAELRPRIAYADERLTHWGGYRDQLARYATHPLGGYHFGSAQVMVEMYAAMKRMLEIELAVHEANLAQVTAPTLPEKYALRDAQADPAFREARLRMDTALATFLWRAASDGIDAVLRATDHEPAREAIDAADAEARAARVAAIKAEAREDLALERLVEALGTDFVHWRNLMNWADRTLAGLDKLEGKARVAALSDKKWAELGEALEELKKLHLRASGYPSLSKWFTRPEAVDLPFGPPSAGEASKGPTSGRAGTDRLDLSAGRSSKFKLG